MPTRSPAAPPTLATASAPIDEIAVLWLTAGLTGLASAAGFDWELAASNIQAVRPGMPIFRVSAQTCEGMDGFLSLLEARLAELRAAEAVGT